MTTEVGIKVNNFLIIGADTQITSGNNKLPFGYPKVKLVGSNLIAGAGSVGYIQNLLNMAVREIRSQAVYEDTSAENISLISLVKTLGSLNFRLPLEHRRFSAFEFLIGGLRDLEPTLFSVGADGSIIQIPTFYATGSGSQLALSILSEKYSEDMSKQQAKELVFEALKQSSGQDIYTNDSFQVFILEMGENNQWFVDEYNSPEELSDREKEALKEPTKEAKK